MKITANDVEDIALGSAFLATGGGGDPYVSALITKQALNRCGGVELIALVELEDDALVMAVGGIGAPLISLEKLPNGKEQIWAINALEQHLGKRADALISFEVGGFNSLMTFIAAAEKGIPVVDADGMGRAFPEMQMTTFSIYGVNGTPMALVDEHNNQAVVTTSETAKAELISRNVALTMGGQCTSAESAMTGAKAKQVAIPGCISLCLQVGKNLHQNRNNTEQFLSDLEALVVDSPYGCVRTLLNGKVIDVSRTTQGGFDVGQFRVADLETKGNEVCITFKNEFLIAQDDTRILASVPDLICIIDSESAQPITSDRIRYGQRILVISLEAPAVYQTNKALKVVGPRAFGFDTDYVSLSSMDSI